MSFFSRYKNFLLEIHEHGQDQSNPQTENVFPVYNFAEWKLTSDHDSSDLNVLKRNEKLLKQTQASREQPFGVIVSSPAEIELAAQYSDFLYIPGEICRQSDILECSAKTQLPLFIERGNFLAPTDISRIIEKIGAKHTIALVDCGTSNGYSDALLDPRVMAYMQNLAVPFGVHLSELLSPEGCTYAHRPHWLLNHDFIQAFIKTAHVFDASFFVIKNYGKGQIQKNQVLQCMARNI
ncbi:hypothetical protein [Silvanigrella aquatica]|uniref:Uncharacterized protein n=1 Tax=Silvanigrella aquatica TaxID=1915309 RepID=A0A1L4D034_9BACT|nr:hypothetical protein [Silvanigrella aquatica]APJ03559.1 hypothetical protein AXG55_06415 [Silvanigrella aquatica]